MIIEIVQAFMTKIMDNGLGTFKSIYLNKEQYFRGALFAAASTFFYLVGVKQVVTGGWVVIGVMTLATFVGTLLPGIFIKRTQRDRLWIFEITASSMEAGKEFADTLRELNLAVKTEKVRNSDLNKVLSCSIYCNSKDESRIVKNLLPKDFKRNILVPIEE